VGAVGSYLYATEVEPHWIKVVRRSLPIRGLPAALRGRTLLQLSDFHVGPVVDTDYLMRTMQLARSLAPDAIMLTGDLIDRDSPGWQRTVKSLLAGLPTPPLGTWAILGNHDYSLGWSNIAVATQVVELMSSMGIRVLRNEVADFHGVQLAGIDDLWSPCFDGARTMRAMDPARPGLVLCHNPDACDLDIWNGHDGWILSGHTHGGQCKPPFLPPPFLPVKNRRYTQGEFALSGGRSLYINAGLGYLKKARFNVRPEMTLFTMTRLIP
jgi:predicted MPP superfamily phosphohydrolase